MQEYLQLHQLTRIPIGVNTTDKEVLTNLHLYMYHRLPDPAVLPKMKRRDSAISKGSKAAHPPRHYGTVMRRVHLYGAEESFGELALASDSRQGKRKARMVTVTTCHFMTVSRADYQRCFEKKQLKLMENKISFLRNMSFFKGWSASGIRTRLGTTPLVKFNKDAQIVKEGQFNEMIFFVWKGEFEVRKKIKHVIPVEDETVKEFLCGKTAKRSIRGIFNHKINKLTAKRGFTNSTEVLKDEAIFTLTGQALEDEDEDVKPKVKDIDKVFAGQIFGEERIVKVLELRERDRRTGKK